MSSYRCTPALGHRCSRCACDFRRVRHRHDPIGLLGLGLGFVIRSTAGAIATLFGIVLVAPLLATALPAPYAADVSKYLPLNAGSQIIATVDLDPTLLSPWAGIAVTAG